MNATKEEEALKMLFQNQHAFLIPKIMFTASDLGVFDLLMESKEPLTSVTIAERLGTSPCGMERLLDACVGLKFLQVERKDNQTLYGNTDLANLYLGKRSPKTQYYSSKFHAEFTYTRAQHLADFVREGETLTYRLSDSSTKNIFDPMCREGDTLTYRLSDSSTKNVFEAMCRTENHLRDFMGYMHDMWSLCSGVVVNAFDLSHFPLVCDVGGCTGALAKECISMYPNSTVTILDLPEVVEIGKKHFVSSEEHRITFHEEAGCYQWLSLWTPKDNLWVGEIGGNPSSPFAGKHKQVKTSAWEYPEANGDFFKDPIPEADLYILARILHCFTDEKCVQLLTRLHKACKPGGGVLVVEIVLNEDRTGPLEGHIYNMVMLLYTQGKERTLSEYNALFSAAGFKEIQQRKTGFFDAILGRK